MIQHEIEQKITKEGIDQVLKKKSVSLKPLVNSIDLTLVGDIEFEQFVELGLTC
jgi:hypothetical protein